MNTCEEEREFWMKKYVYKKSEKIFECIFKFEPKYMIQIYNLIVTWVNTMLIFKINIVLVTSKHNTKTPLFIFLLS